MTEKILEVAIKEFGKQMGMQDLALDFSGCLSFELESGEVFHLEQAQETLFMYLSVEVLPYIVSRILENLYLLANHRTQGFKPYQIGLHKSHIIIGMHLPEEQLTVALLNQTSEQLWDLRQKAFH